MKQDKPTINKLITNKEIKILFEKEKHFFRTIEQFTNPAFLCCDKLILNGNSAAIKLLKYKSLEDFTSSNLTDLLPEKQISGKVSIEQLKEYFEGSCKQGFLKFDFVLQTKTKKSVSIEAIITPIYMEEKWFFTIVLHKFKNLEETNTEHLIKSKFKGLFTKLEKVSVIGYDKDRKVTYWNNTSEKTYGYTKDEAIGEYLENLIVPPSIKEEYINSLADFYRKNTPIASTELKLHDKNNLPIYAFSNHVMIENSDGQKEMYCLNFDITKRKQNEKRQNVLQSISKAVNSINNLEKLISIIKKELNSIIDTTHFYIALYNSENETIHVPFLRTNKVKFEFIPMGISLSSYIFKTKRPLIAKEKKLHQLLNTGEVKILEPGLKIWLGIPLLVKQKLIGVLAVQNFDDENAYSQKDLEFLTIVSQEVGVAIERIRMAEELKLALEKAQESDRLKSSFLANMSHEIRTPMNGIIGFLELLSSPNIEEEKVKKYADIMNKSGQRLLNTINDIIDISRIESGETPVVYKEININKDLRELLFFFKEEAKAKNINLSLNMASNETDYFIFTDQTKIESILTNLIKNAIKFTEKGSIEFGYKITNHELIFFVCDTGVGINEDQLNGIFNRFEQVELKGEKTNEGSGLGLTIAKSYVEMLQGKIWVKSQINMGSEFYFTIPLKIPQNLISLPPKDIDEKYIQPSILFVGDDHNLEDLLEDVLSGFAYTLVYVKTGKEAIDKCKTDLKFDVILLDTSLPDSNAYDVTSSIREFNTSINIIAICSGKNINEKNKALNIGYDACITKPIKAIELMECITSLSKENINKNIIT